MERRAKLGSCYFGEPPHKRAIVVGSNIQFNAGRMAELLDPNALKVFREEQAALDWLFATGAEEKPVEFDRSKSGKIAMVRNR